MAKNSQDIDRSIDLKTKGNDAFKNKDYEKAISYYTEAISLKQDPVLYSNRSQCYLNQKDFFNALDDCDKTLELDPGYVKGFYRRATAYRGLFRFQKALEDYGRVLNLDPTFTKCQADIKELEDVISTDRRIDVQDVSKPDKYKSLSEMKTFELAKQYYGIKYYR